MSAGRLSPAPPSRLPVLPVLEVEDRVHLLSTSAMRGHLPGLKDVCPVSSVRGFVSHLIAKWTCLPCPF